MDEHVACLLRVGESSDFEGEGAPGVCLGPFLKLEVMDRDVPLDYLISKPSPVIFRECFVDAQNWRSGNDFYCYPFTSKEIRIEQRYECLSIHLGEKWERSGIANLIDLSLSPTESNPRVCTALLSFWSSILNCFLLPEGPLTIALEDIYFLTGCSPLGEELRFY